MDRKVKSFRLRVDLLDWLKAYASERGSSEIAVMESALVDFRSAGEGGVPDLPGDDSPPVSPTQQQPVAPFTPRSIGPVSTQALMAKAAEYVGATPVVPVEETQAYMAGQRQRKLNEAMLRARNGR
jgi:hypothetical protein